MNVEKLFLVGLNHLSAPLACREKAAVAQSALLGALGELRSSVPLEEVAVLSTCSRTEVIGVAEAVICAQERVCEWFLRRGGGEVDEALYVLNGAETIRHIFRVASGLDSWIIGESEILGQVKRAYHFALERGFTKRGLNRVFQSAIGAGKNVRAVTGIQNGIHSIGGAAALVAKRIFGDERKGGVVVFGAGQAAETVVRHLAAKNFSRVFVANRTVERAQALAAALGGRAVSLGEGLALLSEVEVAIFSTATSEPLLSAETLAPLLRKRAGAIFLIDLGLPRNVHPDCSKMDSVYLYDLDDLKEMVRESMQGKAGAKEHAETLAARAAEECKTELEKPALAHVSEVQLVARGGAIP